MRIPNIFIIIDGMTSAKIKKSKYLLIADGGIFDAVVVEDGNGDTFFEALCILCPKINDDVPIKKETVARTFPVRPGINASGAP